MPEFFLELFSEEIPARMQRDAADSLLQAVENLARTPDSAANAELFYGPRRIAASATIPDSATQPATVIRGPRAGASAAALAGFIKKLGVPEQNVALEDGYYFYRASSTSEPIKDYIQRVLSGWIEANINWPKSMRWGQGGDFAWVRPLRRIVCLLDGEIVPIVLGSVTAGNETEGHRSLAPDIFSVASVKDWEQKLKKHGVIADQTERLHRIKSGLNHKAKEKGLILVEDVSLYEEVNGLVEWPVPLVGKIDQDFMSLPPEVRELSMKVNQKYFALRYPNGAPAPYFAFVANLEAPDDGTAVIAGNERVLRARLSDARHFWDLDLKTSLDALLPKLEEIVFHASIGTQRHRAEEIAKLASKIANRLQADGGEEKQAEWAGRLCKADLVTGMVSEFPELQGIMGGYYAERNTHHWRGEIVGPAIRTHYQPKGPHDSVPCGRVAESVALADKLYSLNEFFRIGEKPKGSGDPYALRRAALGVIRIILENKRPLLLKRDIGCSDEVFDFIIERLRVKLRAEGQRFDVLDAVLSVGKDDNLVRIMQRVNIITVYLQTEDFKNLLSAYRRAVNIVKIEDKKDGPHEADFSHRKFETNEEDDLQNALAALGEMSVAYGEGDYGPLLVRLAKLRAPVDAFFDNVKINVADQELRLKRLRLLARLRDTMELIADFSKIEA